MKEHKLVKLVKNVYYGTESCAMQSAYVFHQTETGGSFLLHFFHH